MSSSCLVFKVCISRWEIFFSKFCENTLIKWKIHVHLQMTIDAPTVIKYLDSVTFSSVCLKRASNNIFKMDLGRYKLHPPSLCLLVLSTCFLVLYAVCQINTPGWKIKKCIKQYDSIIKIMLQVFNCVLIIYIFPKSWKNS